MEAGLEKRFVTTCRKDINRAKSMKGDFPLASLRRKEDFEYIRLIAQSQKAWRRFSDVVCEQQKQKLHNRFLSLLHDCNYFIDKLKFSVVS